MLVLLKFLLVTAFIFSSYSSAAIPSLPPLFPLAPDEILPQFEKFFREKGIGEQDSPMHRENLLQLAHQLQKDAENNLRSENFAPYGKSWANKKLEFYSYLTGTLNQNQNQRFKEDTFFQGKQIIYMIFAEEKVERADQNARNVRGNFLGKRFGAVLKFFKKRKMFWVNIPPLTLPLGLERAEKEALFLAHPEEPGQLVTRKELALMTPEEVGSLDIPENHPMWRSQRERKKMGNPDLWVEQEKMINRELNQYLDKKFSLTARHPGFSYDLVQHHRVLFFDEIKSSGTSPKINAKDAFGLRWKVKWSPEIHPEVVANRLMMDLGARYVDPVYAILPGREGLTLILKDPKKANSSTSSTCEHPVTPRDFIDCLKKSKYRADISNFIDSSGVITSQNLSEVLKHFPSEALAEKDLSSFVGYHYMTFKEGLVEFSPKDVFLRGGPTSWTRFGARQDRVQRGLLLFNAWINNLDPNEENNKGYLIPGVPGEGSNVKGQQFVYGQHDMGLSLTGILGAGHVNNFSPGGFIFHHPSSRPTQIGFDYFLFHLPGAWQRATYADLLWMGRKIVQLPRRKIEEIVSFTQWPDFMQRALVYKLLARRNLIAKKLDLEKGLSSEELTLGPPFQSVPLGTPEERALAAVKYDLPLEELEALYRDRGHGQGGDGYSDKVLIKGRVAPCESTLLIPLLHRHRHPTGLDRRLPPARSFGRFLSGPKCGGIANSRIERFLRSL